MKKLLNKALPALLLAAFCLPALAQTGESPEGAAGRAAVQAEETPKPVKKPARKKARAKKKSDQLSLDDINPADTGGAPAKKAPAKKKAKKKKPAKPVSEYKFSAVEKVPTYKFDKKANPIVKGGKKKAAKKGTKGNKAPAAATAPKLKPAKSLGAEEKQGDPLQGMLQGAMQGGGGGGQ